MTHESCHAGDAATSLIRARHFRVPAFRKDDFVSDSRWARPPSLWAQTAPPGPDCPALEANETADVVVVGGGFTGLSAALHLAEAGQRVILLEAAEPGFGASGRNGGQVNPGWKMDAHETVAHYGGGEAGRRALAFLNSGPDLVFDLIERHGIVCEAVRPGYIQAAPDASGARLLRHRQAAWADHGVEIEYLEGQEASDLLGTDGYVALTRDPRGGNLQPLAYARGLARAAQRAGAVLHGDSRAQSIDRAPGGEWRVATAGGSVTAPHVLLCTNGYTDDLWPGLRQSVVPVASVIAATQPMPERIAQSVLPGRHGLSDTAHAMIYCKRDAAGRFLIGARGPVLAAPDAGPADRAKRRAVELFPQLAGVDWQFEWGGYVALTRDWTPRVMRPAPGVLAAMGYNGRGVALATATGRDLARAVAGEETGLPLTDGVRPIPFHAFRKFGVAGYLVKAKILEVLGR